MEEPSTMINCETFDSRDDVERLSRSFHEDLIEPKKASSNNVQVIQYVFNFKTSQFEKFSGIQRSSEKLRFSKESKLALDPVIPLIRIDLNRKESRLALLDPVNASIPIQRWEPVVITRPRNENQLRNKKEEVSKGSPKRPTPVIPLIPIDLNKSDFADSQDLREPISTTSRSHLEKYSEIHVNPKNKAMSKVSPRRQVPVIRLIPVDLIKSESSYPQSLDPTIKGERSGGLRKRRRSCERGETFEDGRTNNKTLKVASNNLCITPSVSTSRILIDSPKRVKGKCRPNPCVLLTRLEEMFPATVFQPKNRGEELGQGQSESSPVRILGLEHPDEIEKNWKKGENKLMEWILLGNNGQGIEKEKQTELIICDFCLSYTKKVYIVERHRKKCMMQGLKPS